LRHLSFFEYDLFWGGEYFRPLVHSPTQAEFYNYFLLLLHFWFFLDGDLASERSITLIIINYVAYDKISQKENVL